MPTADKPKLLPVHTLRFAQLEPRARRRLIARTALNIVLTTASLLVVYYWIPLEGIRIESALLYLLAGAAVFVSALIWQVRTILVSDYPEIKAVEAIGLALPLLVCVFALVYVSMAHADPDNFSEQLSRTAGLYFTITVLSTVGFGDITAKTDAARLMVSVQMLLDLVVIGAILKLIVGAARTGTERRRDAQQDENLE